LLAALIQISNEARIRGTGVHSAPGGAYRYRRDALPLRHIDQCGDTLVGYDGGVRATTTPMPTAAVSPPDQISARQDSLRLVFGRERSRFGMS